MDLKSALNDAYYYYSTPEGRATLPTVDCCTVCADLRLDYASVLGHYNPDIYVQTDFAGACSIIAPLPRLLQTATAGCESCSMLHKAISSLSNDRINFSGPTLNAIFHFHPNDILKGYVCRIRRNDPDDPTGYSPVYEDGDPRLPFEFEIYTPMCK